MGKKKYTFSLRGKWYFKAPLIENYGEIVIFKLLMRGAVEAGEVFLLKIINFFYYIHS